MTTEQVETRHPDFVRGQRWCSSTADYKYRCKIHGIYQQSFNNYERGSGCPRCSESLPEKSIAQIFAKLNTVFEQEKVFDDCRNLRPLPFDFYIPSFGVLVEAHGIQHYHPVKRFGGSKKFQRTQHHVCIKRRWARRNGFKLLVGPFVKQAPILLAFG